MYSESHCHLGEITEQAIKEAGKLGFSHLLTSGIDLKSSAAALGTAKKYKIVKACIGVHPWYADEYTSEVGNTFRDLSEDPEVVAISEIGLDFISRMTHEWILEDHYIDPKIQYETIDSQLGIARELSLPAIVHDRAPGQEILELLERSGNVNTGLAIHGFSKGPDYAKRCVDNGIYLSIGLRTIQNGESEYIEAVKQTPLEYLLTETDSGKPEGILTVCDLIGEIKGLDRKEIGTIATNNLKRLLRI